MPTKSKSRITTKPIKAKGLPTKRPPTHPGEMLLEEFLIPLELTQTEFAQRIKVSYPRLNEIIKGKRSVTPDTAMRLEKVLGMPAYFWLKLQLDWDLWHAKHGPNKKEISKLKPYPIAQNAA